MFSVLKLVEVDEKYKNCTTVYPRPRSVNPVTWMEDEWRQSVMSGNASAEVAIPVAQHWRYNRSIHERVGRMSSVNSFFFSELFPGGSETGLTMQGNMLVVDTVIPRRKMSTEEFDKVVGQFFFEEVRHNFGRTLAMDQLTRAAQSMMVPDGLNSEAEQIVQEAAVRDLKELEELADLMETFITRGAQ